MASLFRSETRVYEGSAIGGDKRRAWGFRNSSLGLWPSLNKANKVVKVKGEGDVETGLAGVPALPSKAHHEPTTSPVCGDVMAGLAQCSPTLLDNIIALALIRPRPPPPFVRGCFLGYDGGRSSSNPFAAVCLKSRLLFFAIVELSTFFIFLHPLSLHSRRSRGVVVYRSPPREPASVSGSATLRSIDLTSSPPLS
jgi:hypothetical protein